MRSNIVTEVRELSICSFSRSHVGDFPNFHVLNFKILALPGFSWVEERILVLWSACWGVVTVVTFLLLLLCFCFGVYLILQVSPSSGAFCSIEVGNDAYGNCLFKRGAVYMNLGMVVDGGDWVQGNSSLRGEACRNQLDLSGDTNLAMLHFYVIAADMKFFLFGGLFYTPVGSSSH